MLAVCTFYVDFFFFFNDTATTEIYTLSLHDALPIYEGVAEVVAVGGEVAGVAPGDRVSVPFQISDRKSTRLNSSHLVISYAVFCLKKKKQFRCSLLRLPPLGAPLAQL